MISAKVDVSLNFDQFNDELTAKVKNIVTNSTIKMSRAAQRNVTGPRPSHLEVDTGNLLSSLQEGTSVTDDGLNIIGEVSTDARSSNGFPYAQYWEGLISQGNGSHNPWPRQFAQPALTETEKEFLQSMGNLS